MSFDFMKNLIHWEDEERFVRLCETLEGALREAQSQADKNRAHDLELMQALDFVGFNLFRDNWEEFKKMNMNRELPSANPARRDKMFLH